MTWDDLLSLATEHEPACHGYANSCGCVRCTDRHDRMAALEHEGAQNAAALAKRHSDDYFARPWRYWDSGDGTPPVLLKELA